MTKETASEPACTVDDQDPWFRTEVRIPECGPPWPAGLTDPLSPQLLDTARDLWRWIVSVFWSPATLANFPGVWQWKKFEFLDWLRPLELLLRRLLMIEALGLAASQSLPPPRGQGPKRIAQPAARPAFDPDRPETWRICFHALPQQRPGGPHRPLPPVQPDRQFREAVWAKRYRRKLHDPMPLARRLEAALRVIQDPAAYARRLAFRLRRGRSPAATLLLIPRRPPRRRFAGEAIELAGRRAAELASAFWSSA